MLSLHQLPKTHGKRRKRLGRGNSSHGAYSGRGIKGQRARSGGRGGLKLRGLKQSLMAMPKARGFKSIHAKAQVVNLKAVSKAFAVGETVTVATLLKKGLIEYRRAVKLLGNGKMDKALTIQLQGASKSALEAVKAAGGSFEAVTVSGGAVKGSKPASKKKMAAKTPAEAKV